MNSNERIFLTIIIAVLVGTLKVPLLNGMGASDINFNLNKLYNILLIAFFMSLAGLIINYAKVPLDELLIWIFILTTGLIIFYYMIVNQTFVNNNDYLLALKENHQTSIAMSKKMLDKYHIDQKTKDLANNIIQTHNSEINQINKLLDEYKK
jgi:hypothetical protein